MDFLIKIICVTPDVNYRTRYTIKVRIVRELSITGLFKVKTGRMTTCGLSNTWMTQGHPSLYCACHSRRCSRWRYVAQVRACLLQQTKKTDEEECDSGEEEGGSGV